MSRPVTLAQAITREVVELYDRSPAFRVQCRYQAPELERLILKLKKEIKRQQT